MTARHGHRRCHAYAVASARKNVCGKSQVTAPLPAFSSPETFTLRHVLALRHISISKAKAHGVAPSPFLCVFGCNTIAKAMKKTALALTTLSGRLLTVARPNTGGEERMFELMKRNAVAKALAVHPLTVTRLVERGELPCVRIGKALRFRPADVEHLLEKSVLKTQQ